MPDTTTAPVVPPPETVVVSETVTVFPTPVQPPPEPPAPPPPPPEPPAEPVLGEAELRELLDGLNTMNTTLEGGSELPSTVLLDPMQFGALGLGLALVLALLGFFAVAVLRR